ncbi:MAG TPA: radical SAM protein [Desulfobulbus sp.]|nr:radical SAM protein [Desulfobulbus sp.]
MKCLLVIPSWQPGEIFPVKTAASQVNYWQPLGTLMVAASLQRAGHEVRFLNGAFLGHAEILQQAGKFGPSFIGLYATAFGWAGARRTARDLKRFFPGVFIAVGGPYPMAVRRQCLARCRWIDGVVTGEGEITVVALVDRLAGGRPLEGVPGIVYRDGIEIRDNGDRELITDLDSLPFPARELLGTPDRYIPAPATYRRRPVAVIMTSRGCDRKCIYCFQMDRSRKSGIRYRSIDNVLAEIELCLAQGYREIKFIDETLAADYDRAMRLAAEITARRLDFTWFASACVNQVDRPLLQAFRRAGCWAILMGVESGVQKNLNTLRKGITLAQVQRAVRTAREVGLRVFTPFLFGIPGETFAEGLETIRFACELNPDVANFHCLTPFPGTDLHDNLEQYGTAVQDLSAYTYQGAAFVPHTMRREEILALRQLAFRKFYSRPGFLVRRIVGLRSTGDLRAAVSGMRSLFWLWAREGIFRRGGLTG